MAGEQGKSERAERKAEREIGISIYLLIVVAGSFHANRKHAPTRDWSPREGTMSSGKLDFVERATFLMIAYRQIPARSVGRNAGRRNDLSCAVMMVNAWQQQQSQPQLQPQLHNYNYNNPRRALRNTSSKSTLSAGR
jgi:hypothetical protein